MCCSSASLQKLAFHILHEAILIAFQMFCIYIPDWSPGNVFRLCLCNMAFAVPYLFVTVVVTCLNSFVQKNFQECPVYFFSDDRVMLQGVILLQ